LWQDETNEGLMAYHNTMLDKERNIGFLDLLVDLSQQPKVDKLKRVLIQNAEKTIMCIDMCNNKWA